MDEIMKIFSGAIFSSIYYSIIKYYLNTNHRPQLILGRHVISQINIFSLLLLAKLSLIGSVRVTSLGDQGFP